MAGLEQLEGEAHGFCCFSDYTWWKQGCLRVSALMYLLS